MKQKFQPEKWGLVAAYVAGMAMMFLLLQVANFETSLDESLNPSTSDASESDGYLPPQIPEYCASINSWVYEDCAQYPNVELSPPESDQEDTLPKGADNPNEAIF